MTERQQDPWVDIPRWSDGEGAAPADGANLAAAGETGPVHAAQDANGHLAGTGGGAAADLGTAHGPSSCSWCATPAAEGATRCATCGAALAQRESIGDLVIPGLTAVDPALKDLDGRPIHLTGPSPTQGLASGIVVAAAAGGPLGLAILGGVGAVAAAEYMGASRDKPGAKGHDNVGETSEAVLQAIGRLERGEPLPARRDPTPWPELDTPAAPAGPQSARPDDTEETTHGGR